MRALDAIVVINDLAASQRGLFTAAQAQALGVDRVSLARLADRGQIERLCHGVYRSGGAPLFREVEILAAWMALEPTLLLSQRDRGAGGFVASLNTAAWLQELGELNPTPITFSHPARRQVRKRGLLFVKRELAESDVTEAGGIPATTPGRTVLDLLDSDEDLSLVGGVLNDALGFGFISDENRFALEVNERASRRGFDKGFPLYEYLRRR